MSVEMKTLTIGGTTYEIVDETAREKAKKFLGENPTGGEGNDTTDFWVESGPGYCWISEWNQIVNQPTQYGFLINYSSDTDVFQIFRDQNEGETYFRSGDHINNWFQHWTKVYDSANLTPETLGVIDGKCVDKTSGDVTDLLGKESCRYVFSSAVTGMPVDNKWWFVDVLSNGYTDLALTAVTVSTEPVKYIRSCINNVWGEWVKVATSADIPGMATTSKLGLVMVNGNNGIGVNTEDGNLYIKGAETNEIDGKAHSYKPITPDKLDYAVKAGLVNNANTLSSTEKTKVLQWIGAAASGHTHAEPNTDYTTVRARGIALAQDEAISVPEGCLCGVYTIS